MKRLSSPKGRGMRLANATGKVEGCVVDETKPSFPITLRPAAMWSLRGSKKILSWNIWTTEENGSIRYSWGPLTDDVGYDQFGNMLWSDPKAPAALGSLAILVETDGRIHVFFRARMADYPDGCIWQVVRTPEGELIWSGAFIGNDENGHEVKAEPPLSDPGVMLTANGDQHVFYAIEGGRIQRIQWIRSNHSYRADYWTAAGAPPAAGAPTAFVEHGGEQHVCYRASDSTLHQIVWDPKTQERTHWPITSPGMLPASGDPCAYYGVWTGFQWIAYRNSNEQIAFLRWPNPENPEQWWIGSWSPGGAPYVASNPGLFVNSVDTPRAPDVMGVIGVYLDLDQKPVIVTAMGVISRIGGQRSPLTWLNVGSKPFVKSTSDEQRLKLLQQYCPDVWLAEGDAYKPSSVDFAFKHMTRNKRATKLGEVYCLHTIDNWYGRKFPEFFKGELPARVYGFYIDKQGPLTELTYFFYYPFNRGTAEDFYYRGNHVSDWEHVTIRLIWDWDDRQRQWVNPSPWVAGLSAHGDFGIVAWASLEKQPDFRPIVYSAYGTHAFYRSSGTHVHHGFIQDYCSRGILWTPQKEGVLEAYYWAPSNVLEIGNTFELFRLDSPKEHPPAWLQSTQYDKPGPHPHDPHSGASYVWGNPRSILQWIGDGITGPLDKDGVWRPWVLEGNYSCRCD